MRDHRGLLAMPRDPKPFTRPSIVVLALAVLLASSWPCDASRPAPLSKHADSRARLPGAAGAVVAASALVTHAGDNRPDSHARMLLSW